MLVKLDTPHRNTAYPSLYGALLQKIVMGGDTRTCEDDSECDGKYKDDPEIMDMGHWRDYADRRDKVVVGRNKWADSSTGQIDN